MANANVKEGELCVLVPNILVGDSGEPLSNQILALIQAMVSIYYWPIDFGEDNWNSTELWFKSCPSKEEAQRMANGFIALNGYV